MSYYIIHYVVLYLDKEIPWNGLDSRITGPRIIPPLDVSLALVMTASAAN